jgi:serine/threonine-protein kinase HipA
MTADVLSVVVAGRELGRVERERKKNRLRFIYTEDWRRSTTAFALSLSMPLAAAEHGHTAIDAFLWGLLPDNEIILERWARRFQVSARNPFALIAHVGEDCPGAVQFVAPDRAAPLASEPTLQVAWLDELDIAHRIRALQADQAAWRATTDVGQFSLAGAQPKTALFYDGKRFGVPAGRTPTTHIMKPPMAKLDGQCENEHICLTLARTLGLPSASSRVQRFGEETVIVVERYDRAATSTLAATAAAQAASSAADAAAATDPQQAADAAAQAAAAAARAAALATLAESQPVLRLHQEDLCQALAFLPSSKYQSEGGPTPRRIVELLRIHSSSQHDDVATFVEALAFNWLIGGTDAHAKNYSLLHGAGGRIRLAPLYDLVSALPYFEPRKIKLAMKIGGTYRMHDIGAGQWQMLAHELELDEAQTLSRVSRLAERMPDAVAAVRAQARRDGLEHSVVGRLCELLEKNAERCQLLLRSTAARRA